MSEKHVMDVPFPRAASNFKGSNVTSFWVLVLGARYARSGEQPANERFQESFKSFQLPKTHTSVFGGTDLLRGCRELIS